MPTNLRLKRGALIGTSHVRDKARAHKTRGCMPTNVFRSLPIPPDVAPVGQRAGGDSFVLIEVRTRRGLEIKSESTKKGRYTKTIDE